MAWTALALLLYSCKDFPQVLLKSLAQESSRWALATVAKQWLPQAGLPVDLSQALSLRILENTTWYCAPALFGSSYWESLFSGFLWVLKLVCGCLCWLIGHLIGIAHWLGRRALLWTEGSFARAPSSTATASIEPGSFYLVARH